MRCESARDCSLWRTGPFRVRTVDSSHPWSSDASSPALACTSAQFFTLSPQLSDARTFSSRLISPPACSAPGLDTGDEGSVLRLRAPPSGRVTPDDLQALRKCVRHPDRAGVRIGSGVVNRHVVRVSRPDGDVSVEALLELEVGTRGSDFRLDAPTVAARIRVGRGVGFDLRAVPDVVLAVAGPGGSGLEGTLSVAIQIDDSPVRFEVPGDGHLVPIVGSERRSRVRMEFPAQTRVRSTARGRGLREVRSMGGGSIELR